MLAILLAIFQSFVLDVERREVSSNSADAENWHLPRGGGGETLGVSNSRNPRVSAFIRQSLAVARNDSP